MDVCHSLIAAVSRSVGGTRGIQKQDFACGESRKILGPLMGLEPYALAWVRLLKVFGNRRALKVSSAASRALMLLRFQGAFELHAMLLRMIMVAYGWYSSAPRPSRGARKNKGVHDGFSHD